MDNKRQQMEIISHKNLTTVVWTNEVHRILTIYFWLNKEQ